MEGAPREGMLLRVLAWAVTIAVFLAALSACAMKPGWACGTILKTFPLSNSRVPYKDGATCAQVCDALGATDTTDCSFEDLEGAHPAVDCTVPDECDLSDTPRGP